MSELQLFAIHSYGSKYTNVALAMDHSSIFMRLVGQKLRQGRAYFNPPDWSAYTRGSHFASIWFPSGGCVWDAQGYCTMCNYGRSKRVSPDRMIASVEKALSSLTIEPTILWVGAYNMFDEREVPAEARRAIFAMLAKTSATEIITETHPDSVSEHVVRECKEILGGDRLGIEVGIESTNALVRNWCINKDFDQEQMRTCIERIHAGGARCYANLLLGAPFLSSKEAVDDVLHSVIEGAGLGIDYFVILPNHIKPHTLVAWLHARQLYTQPSLWALIEVLQRLQPELLARVFTSWVESEDVPGKSSEEVVPRFEDEDSELPLSYLRRFTIEHDMSALRKLFEYNSAGRSLWRQKNEEPVSPFIDRMEALLPRVGSEILGSDWWDSYGEGVIHKIRTDWDKDSTWLKTRS